MTTKTKRRLLTAAILSTAVIGGVFLTNTIAQSNTNTISGVYGCTMRDDRWGLKPTANGEYDVSGLVWIIDATNKKMSGIDLRHSFSDVSGSSGSIIRKEPKYFKDEATTIQATELMNVYTLTVEGDDGLMYLVATNGGNTLLVSEGSSSSRVSASGICQKM